MLWALGYCNLKVAIDPVYENEILINFLILWYWRYSYHKPDLETTIFFFFSVFSVNAKDHREQ